uniref:Transposase n=1 Tax=Ascaris lumbricoides TaxID=6252 RepID=A0A0M3HX00_ASCLU
MTEGIVLKIPHRQADTYSHVLVKYGTRFSFSGATVPAKRPMQRRQTTSTLLADRRSEFALQGMDEAIV